MHILSLLSSITTGYWMCLLASSVFITNLRFDYKLMCIHRLFRPYALFCVYDVCVDLCVSVW